MVLCTGVRPNIDFVNPDQVDLDQAILVDEQTRTSAPNLYAAGDVSQGANLLSGRRECFGNLAKRVSAGTDGGSEHGRKRGEP